MKKFIQLLTTPENNVLTVTRILLAELNIPVTRSATTKMLDEHPDQNSLLSISDCLRQFGVDNLTARFETEKLLQLPLPFITQLRGASGPDQYFTVVRRADAGTVYYYDPELLKWLHTPAGEFKKRCTGLALLAEADENAGEKDYQKNRKAEKRKSLQWTLAALLLPLALLAAGIAGWMQAGTAVIPSLIYALLCLTGTAIGCLLLWYELDSYNPALQQICGSGKHVSCGAILQSGASKIAGISWSTIGFTYFTGSVFLMVFAGITNPVVHVTLACLNLAAVPYVFFSVYYQWRVARQWCALCLSVQALLLLQLATVLSAGWASQITVVTVAAGWLPAVLAAYGIPFALTHTLIPVFQKAKESRLNYNRLQQLKHNPQIFDSLLARQKEVTTVPEGLGITLGKPSAVHKIIKVCNPYCGPCSRAHTPMEALLENNPDVQVQIIFTASNKEGDRGATPVRHLMALASRNDETLIKQGLDDWYLSNDKDYKRFSAKYPMNGELQQQNGKIEAMHQWCTETGISFTPTFFINGHQLPEIYSVEDLKYFLMV